MARAHGFLPKVPTEPDYKAVLRQWIKRHGAGSLPMSATQIDPAPLTSGARTRLAADAELRKVTRLLQDNLGSMPWAELSRWLHRIKGVVATVKTGAAKDDPRDDPAAASADKKEMANLLAEAIINEIESLRPLTEAPANLVGRWALLFEMIVEFLDHLEGMDHVEEM